MSDWHHAPPHRFREGNSVYFVTGATEKKQHFYRRRDRLDALRTRLFALAEQHECRLQAWALFSNHYHLVVSGSAVREMLTLLHTQEGFAANDIDQTPGRRVWYQFRDTELTFERSWLARLRYTHENAVHHGLVLDATQYRWCSAAWFEAHAPAGFVATIRRIKIDRVNVSDDFLVVPGD